MAAQPRSLAESSPPHAARTLILGLGNPLLSDDAVGLRVVQQLRPLLAGQPDVEVAEEYWGGLRLMERMVGYARVIIVDAVCSGQAPGTVCVRGPEGIDTQHSASSHDVNLTTALEFGRRAGARLPEAENTRLVVIEAADVLTFGETCSPPVQAAVQRAVQAVMTLLSSWR